MPNTVIPRQLSAHFSTNAVRPDNTIGAMKQNNRKQKNNHQDNSIPFAPYFYVTGFG
jgi:hypothetical protein